MAGPVRIEEGFVQVEGGSIWYEVVGNGAGVPLIAIHGGPGCPHDYLRTLTALADERPVIFYDQLGCGRSDHPSDPGLWSVARFVDELSTLRVFLGLDRLHILGHSWGTIVATEFAYRQPPGLLSLILASPAISLPRWASDLAELRKRLPAPLRATLDRHETAGTTRSNEYLRATALFYQHHVCRLNPLPELVRRSFDRVSEDVYGALWGPNEFTVTGSLKHYDSSSRLSEIDVPSLFTCGRFDEATPDTTAYYQSRLPRSELIVFERSSHLAMIEQEPEFTSAIRAFLRRVDVPTITE